MDTEIPLFPLRSVLFPGGYLPLRIFEPRYLDMVQRCHAQGEPFGVVSLTEGQEVRQRDGAGFQREAFHTVGTLARIEHFAHEQPGLIQLRTRGTQRFRLGSARCLSHGLWVGVPELLAQDVAVPVPEELRSAALRCASAAGPAGELARARRPRGAAAAAAVCVGRRRLVGQPLGRAAAHARGGAPALDGAGQPAAAVGVGGGPS
jgi:Lon protease-like protein